MRRNRPSFNGQLALAMRTPRRAWNVTTSISRQTKPPHAWQRVMRGRSGSSGDTTRPSVQLQAPAELPLLSD